MKKIAMAGSLPVSYTHLDVYKRQQWIQVWRLRRQAKDDLVASGAVHGGWTPEIRRFVRHLFPLILFNCIQAHVATWLLSVFAHAQAVADVGALARLSIIFSFFGLPMAQIVIPIIAKTQEPRRLAHVCLFTSVSYTHLDVYKRQWLHGVKSACGRIN